MTKTTKKKRIPFFRPQTLLFEDSNHELRISDRHYRCDLDCKGKCGLSEPQIKTDTLEKQFTRLSDLFKLDEEIVETMRIDLTKKYFTDILFHNIDQKDTEQDKIDRTLLAMQKDNKAGLKIDNEDVPDIEAALVRQQELDYPILLFGYMIGFIAGLSPLEEPAQRARNLALISKKILINDKGKIVSMEFERWGWYMINYIERYKPGYIDCLSKVSTLNKNDELIGLDLFDALNYFDTDNFEEALHNHSANDMYLVFKMLKDMTKNLISGNSQQMQSGLVQMMTTMTQLPQVELATKLKPLLK